MRRLFWYIFVSFIVANAAATISVMWWGSRLYQADTIPGLGMTRLQLLLDGYLTNADRALARSGDIGLRDWLESVNKEGVFQVYAVDSQSKPLSGSMLPDDVAAVLTDGAGSASPGWLRTLHTTYGGERYRIVARFEPSLFGRFMRAPLFDTLVLLTLAASTAAGLLLAWYIARPLERIQTSVKRYAGGDLDARVGELRFGRATEIVTLAREFDKMTEQIKSLVESYQRLVRDVSHELRSPLARLYVALELARSPEPALAESALQRIESEADCLENMLIQTMEFSKLQNTVSLELDSIALDELLKEIVENADYEGAVSGRRVQLLEEAPLFIRGDFEALYSTFENVIRNAVRYTQRETVVEVRLWRSNDARAMISVRDHGPGILGDEATRIFEPYYRTESARAQNNNGIGLGLAIARSAIERHHGRIHAKNREEGGLEIVIELPMAS